MWAGHLCTSLLLPTHSLALCWTRNACQVFTSCPVPGCALGAEAGRTGRVTAVGVSRHLQRVLHFPKPPCTAESRIPDT